MTLGLYPATPRELQDLELRSLQLIMDSKVLAGFNSKLRDDAETQFLRLKGLRQFRSGTPILDFESYLDMSVESKELRVFFGGKVFSASQTLCDNASYYVAICDLKTNDVLKKIHFDFDSGADRRSRSKKPFYHMQVGGAYTPRMLSEGIDKSTEKLFTHGLDVPRVAYMPMSLISIVGLIFREFQPEKAIEIFEDKDWKAHLKRCELGMLRDFYRTCNSALSSGQSLLWNCFYH